MLTKRLTRSLVVLAILALPRDVGPQSACGDSRVSTYHPAQCNSSGRLVPWLIDASGPFHSIMNLQARWWLNAPAVSGWPAYLTAAELSRTYVQANDAIPGSSVAMAVEAYLKYYAYTGNAAYLNMVGTMGDYIVQQDLTPAAYVAYPRFPWPTGNIGDITPDGGGQGNIPGNVMPDKGAMIGIALLHLYEATGSLAYRDEAIQIANVLTTTAVTGTTAQSPWPFRATGDSGGFVDGPVSGNQVFALRLFDELIRLGLTGNGQYQTTRATVWNWLKTVAIADVSGDKWMHFFEDHGGNEYNPTQINALEMARYLLEKKEALDPNWFSMAGSLIDLVKRRWVVHSGDYTAIGEQQVDMTPYNSHTARYASILAKYYEAGGPTAYKDEAYSSFAYSTYSVASDGFADTYFNGGMAWASDSFGDWMQHFMDGMAAIPEWAPATSDHLLRSSSVVQTVTYGSNAVSYVTFDPAGQEKLKLAFTPSTVRVDGSPITSWTWDSLTHVLIVDRANGTLVAISGDATGPDFGMAVTPGSQSVLVGSSTAYTVSITSVAGFTGTVNLSVSGLPSGATGAFSPMSVAGSGSSTLTVTTNASTPAGTYTLTITGTSGTLSHLAVATLAVTTAATTITFDDISPANRVLSGQYPTGVINWGSGTSWYLSGPWGLFTTQSISFVDASLTSASFSFVSNSGLSSFQAYNGGSASSTVTISCAGQPSVQSAVPAGTVKAINTGWTTPCSTVTLTSSNGYYTNFDNLAIFTGSSAGPDFSISATPGSQTVVRGNATSYMATVTALNGFGGGVGFNVTGLPTGATGTFTPTSVTGSGSSTLNVMTSSTTPIGSSTVTISGTSGSLSHTTTVSLVVNASADFSLTATPNSRTVVQGSGTSYTATVGALNGFSGVVGFSVAGLPAGAAGTFTSSSVTGSGSSTLNVTTSSTTPIGSYTVTVAGSSGALTHNAVATLVVNTTAPPPSSGLVAAFGFNEGSGTTARDASGTGNNGTTLNATWTTAGRYGTALVFNGSNTWITIPDASSLHLTTSMTLQAWVYPRTPWSGWRSVLMKERPGQLAYALYGNTDTSRPSVEVTAGSNTDVRGTAVLPASTWSHLAATYDGSTLRLYVNGAQVSSRPVTGAIFVSTNPLRIGGNSVWGEWFNGYIDEVRIYNRALTASQIGVDMNTPIP